MKGLEKVSVDEDEVEYWFLSAFFFSDQQGEIFQTP